MAVHPSTMDPSYPSGASVTNRNLLSRYDDGNLPFSAGKFQHFLQLSGVFLDIDIDCPGTVGRPGLIRKRSATLSVNDDLFFHDLPPSDIDRVRRKTGEHTEISYADFFRSEQGNALGISIPSTAKGRVPPRG